MHRLEWEHTHPVPINAFDSAALKKGQAGAHGKDALDLRSGRTHPLRIVCNQIPVLRKNMPIG